MPVTEQTELSYNYEEVRGGWLFRQPQKAAVGNGPPDGDGELEGDERLAAAAPSSSQQAGPLLSAVGDDDGELDFCMTNPPFFGSLAEAVV